MTVRELIRELTENAWLDSQVFVQRESDQMPHENFKVRHLTKVYGPSPGPPHSTVIEFQDSIPDWVNWKPKRPAKRKKRKKS